MPGRDVTNFHGHLCTQLLLEFIVRSLTLWKYIETAKSLFHGELPPTVHLFVMIDSSPNKSNFTPYVNKIDVIATVEIGE